MNANNIYIEFIKNKIDSSNILLFLSDMTSISTGTNGYGYEIDKAKIEEIISIEKVEQLLGSVKTESELKDVILNAFYPPGDGYHKNRYYTNNYVDLNKLIYLYINGK